MKISIIIPAHNEEVRIGKTLDSYTKFFKEKKKNKEIENFEIIVVANACKDNTVKVVEKFRKKYREIKLLNFELGGKGFAIQEGFKESLQGDSGLIGFVDADMATSPENFYDLVKKIGNHDGIIASRYLKGSIVKPKQPFMRLLASRIFNFIVWYIATPLAILSLTIGGVMILISAGNPQWLQTGKETIKWAIVGLVLEGIDAVSAVRLVCGSTKARESEGGTIRGDFGMGWTANIVHASDSIENAVSEIERFFDENETITVSFCFRLSHLKIKKYSLAQ